jgi:hypothetical protein
LLSGALRWQHEARLHRAPVARVRKAIHDPHGHRAAAGRRGATMPEERRNSFLTWLSRPEAIIGLCAVVVSVIAVFVSAYEARIQREWQRAAVWPYVQLNRSFYYSDSSVPPEQRKWTLTLNAENAGVGPARVKDFRVTVDGKPQRTWRAAMQALLGTQADIQYGESTINGIIIPAGRSVQMFQYLDQPDAEKLYGSMKRLDFSACFCSVFDECWRTSYQGSDAESVDDCERDANSFEE